jgi:DNA invertase Pin-like site-specific DNA recombinase
MADGCFCTLAVVSTPEPNSRRAAVSKGMAAARRRGVRLGRPPAPVPAAARRAAELRAEGRSLAEIAVILAAEGVPTPSGRGTWRKSSVQYVLARWDRDGDVG